MGREVRRVPKGWEHPKKPNGDYIPLFDGSNFSKELMEWDEGAAKWAEGLRDDWNGGWRPLEDDEKDMTFEEWHGGRPQAEDYMPEWPEEKRTHLMMYEDCSEGTPISPAFETPEELARWLADNKASSFGSMTASYEQWLGMCKAGWAPSAVCDSTGLHSGVEAIEQIGEVLTQLAERTNGELLALSADEIAAEWYWRWEDGRSIEWNTYMFSDTLELQKRRWRRWEERHNGSCCVVERVRDKYVMPRVREFLAELAAH